MICISNFSPVPRTDYRIGLPAPGYYRELLNSDAALYGGDNRGNGGGLHAEPLTRHGRSWSARFVLPPHSTLWFEVPAY
jgi:1,4-alpha-glucan branching enzyme